MSNQLDHINNQNLFEELASLIEQSKQRIAVAANRDVERSGYVPKLDAKLAFE